MKTSSIAISHEVRFKIEKGDACKFWQLSFVEKKNKLGETIPSIP